MTTADAFYDVSELYEGAGQQAGTAMALCEHPAPTSRALVAESDPQVQEEMRAILNDMGYDVIVADNGEEALSYLHRLGGVSLVVADLMILKIDGLELIMSVKRYDPTIPVVAVAGGSQQRLRLYSAQVRGAASVLPKPFNRWQFMDAVDSATA